VSIAVGQARSASTLAAGGIAFDPLAAGATTVAATAPNVVATTAASVSMTVNAPTFTFSLGSTRVGAGLRSPLSVLFLGAPAPTGGLNVTIASSSGSVLRVSDNGATTVGTTSATINVPAGGTTAQFYMHGMEGAAGTVTLTASAPGFTDATASTTVAAAGIDIIGLNTSTTAGAADDVVLARVGVVDAAGTAMYQEQDVRPGGITVVVTLTNSNAAVARLTTTAGSAQSRTVSIVIGQARSPNTVATGGIAFDPLAAGTTTVSATGSGGVIATDGAAVTVTINP